MKITNQSWRRQFVCRGSIERLFLLSLCLATIMSCSSGHHEHKTLKDAFAGKFLIGTAMNVREIAGADTVATRLIKQQFDAIVAENCMKSENIQPEEGQFHFEMADRLVAFARKNHLVVTGHTLIWHSQTPAWFFTDSTGNQVSRGELIQRMKKHIETLVGRYRGRVKGWDVVNEAINDDGSYRKSKFYEIIGKEYIPMAFKFAHEADPKAELYYNDYSTAKPEKRAGIVAMVKDLQRQGIRINAIGMQTHIGLDFPDIHDYENTMEAFAALGVKVMVTEMDLTVLPSPHANVGAEVSASFDYQKKLNPYAGGLPDSVIRKFNARYTDFFKLFLKHQKQISRVTLWGISDAESWRNDWPVKGRTDYPLLFDRNYQPKPIVEKLIQMAKNN